MHGSLGTFDLDVEILDTIERDSLAEASEGFDGHDRSLGVGTGVGRKGGWVSDQHQGQHVGTPPPILGYQNHGQLRPKGQSCQHLG